MSICPGCTSTDWFDGTNWSGIAQTCPSNAGVPTSAVDAIIGDANFTGPNQPGMTGKSFCRSLTIGAGAKASTLTVQHTLNVSGNITIGANGDIEHNGGASIFLTGNWNNGGIYNANQNKSTVVFSGTSQTLSGPTTFRRLTVNVGSSTALNANVSVTG